MIRWAATASLALLLSAASAAGQDLPPAAPNLRVIPAGSLVIPMDNAKQNLGGAAFNLKAYGLVTQILWAEFPVQWAIRAGKGKDGVDFTARVTRVLPTTTAAADVSFSGGPFIIDSAYASEVLPLVAGAFGSVAVYRLETAATIDIRTTLLHKPKVAILDDGGNAQIHEAILEEAGFVSGVQYAEVPAATLTTINASSCFTIATEPHCTINCGPAQTGAIRAFTQSGGNFLAQCAAILAYENEATAGRYQTTNGVVASSAIITFSYSQPDLPFSQFDGALAVDGGSVHDYSLAAGSSFRNGGHPQVGTVAGDILRATVSKLAAGAGGVVHYLGGHDFSGAAIEQINGRRMYLNSILAEAVRPPPCGLNFIVVRDLRVRVLEDPNGDGVVADSVARPGATVRLWRDGGDGAANGADDTSLGTRTTAADGSVVFASLPTGPEYWATVDSLSVTPASGLRGGHASTEIWSEQTYGSAGALCDDGAGGVRTLAAPGACHGGRRAETTDSAGSLAGSEHVIAVTQIPGLGGTVDLAFSFSAIVHTRDATAAGPARTIQGSLRQFLQNSNALNGSQASVFRIPASSSGYDGTRWRTQLLSDLPALDDPLVLDASTQPGFAGRPLVELDGGGIRDCLDVEGAASTVRGLAIGGCAAFGILVARNGGTRIEGCHVGTDASGTIARPNRGGGIDVRSSGNFIGGTAAGTGNIVSGNLKSGIRIEASAADTLIAGNRIGTDLTGTFDLGNAENGLDVRGANTLVGGTTAPAGNLISGNGIDGVSINGNVTGTRLFGNSIGTGIDGRSPIGNDGSGVTADNIAGLVVGGIAAGEGNVIAHNGTNGVTVIANGSGGNRIRGNAIFENSRLGIDLDDDGVTPNDRRDTDHGPNELQNYPVITGVTSTGASITVSGTLDGDPSSTFTLDFYLENAPDPSGFGEGERYIGSGTVSTDGNGLGAFSITLSASSAGAQAITATATEATNGTSEFSSSYLFRALSGVVYEDADGDGVLTDAVPRGGAVVRIWLDGGDDAPGGDDSFYGTTTTGADGGYKFGDAVPGVYWVGVDSKTVSPSAGFNAASAIGDVWAEQTYGTAGALCQDGAGGVAALAAAGACHGGRRAASSDVASASGTSEHLTRVEIGSTDVTGVDSAFSFATITNTRDGDDDGAAIRTVQGSLRQFLQNGNAVVGTSTSRFRIPTSDPEFNGAGFGEFRIRPLTALPTVTDPVVLDGSTQPGFTSRPIVELDGSRAGGNVNGLRITAGASTVRALVIDQFKANGIFLSGGGSNRIEGNWIGTDVTGTDDSKNDLAGVRVESGNNFIGGGTPATRNVVSGNGTSGVLLTKSTATGNVVSGNYIGVSVSGAAAVGNTDEGIRIEAGAHDNTIGGASPGAGNVVSASGKQGIIVTGAATSGNQLSGNLIGLNAAGNAKLGNKFDGVLIDKGASSNRIGIAGAGNVIAGNLKDGVLIKDATTRSNRVEGNYIGTDPAGGLDLGNAVHGVEALNCGPNGIGGPGSGAGNVIAWSGKRGVSVLGTSRAVAIRANSIRDNSLLGIDLELALSADLPNPNDAGDVDAGPNDLQNYPVLGSVQIAGGQTTIQGTLNSRPSETFTVDLFSSPAADPSGFGEGATYLGSDLVTTDATGNVSFAIVIAAVVPPGAYVTATATNAAASSSEFGRPLVVPNPIDLSLTKQVDRVAPAVGEQVVFGLKLTNAAGAANATGVVVIDLLPAGYAYQSHVATPPTTYDGATGRWTVPALAAGQEVTLDLTATVNPAGPYLNTAEVTAAVEPDLDSIPGDGTGDDFASVQTTPGVDVDLSLAKSVDQAAPMVGSLVVFTLVLHNEGPAAATNVKVTDLLPASYTYVSDDAAAGGTAYDPPTGVWKVPVLPLGTDARLQITARVGPAGPYLNAAEVTACDQPDVDSTPADGTGDDFALVAPVPIPVPAIDLSLSKSVDDMAPGVGTNVVFTITLANAAGYNDASGIQVDDLLPAGYTYLSDDAVASGTTYDSATGAWRVSSLLAGASVALRITARVESTGGYANEAEVVAANLADFDSTPGDRTGDDFASVTPVPGARIDLELSKAVSDPSPVIGSAVTFQLTLHNDVTSFTATGVRVADLLPAGYGYISDDSASSGTTYDPATGVWTVGSVPPGASVVLRILVSVRAAGPYRNAAEVVSADQPDLDSTPGDGAGDDYATAATTPLAAVDLSLVKTIDDAAPMVGATVIFTITVANETGLVDATGVTVVDRLPAGYTYLSDDASSTSTAYDPVSGVWTIGTIPTGGSRALEITARVLSSGPFMNEAEVAAANELDVDSTPGDGAGDDHDFVTPGVDLFVDLSLAKTVDRAAPVVGSTVTFTLDLANGAGHNDATGVEVTDLLPPGYAYLSDDAASSGTSYDSATGVWAVPAVPAGASRTLHIDARVLATGSYANQAEVTAAAELDTDSTPGDGAGDDYAAASTTPTAVIDLSLTKTVDSATAPVGSNVVFTLVVSNAAGGTDATGVAISDPLPAGFAWVSDDAAAGGTSYDRTSGVWTVGNVPAGSARTLRITARVLATGPWWNAAQVSTADQPDLDSTAGNGVGNGEDDEAGVGAAPPGHDGIVDVTDTLRPGEAAVVTITDEDLDLDGGVVESFSTTLLDEATGEVETVLLVETGPATGAFRGSIATAFGTGAGPNGDATLQVKAGDRLACSYSDERTASGGSLTRIDRGLVTGGVDGTIQVAATVDAGSPLAITVVDADLDTNPGAIDAFTIEVINDATGEAETVLVSETGPNTGSFTGTVGTTLGTTAGPPGDGALVVRLADTLTAHYLDEFTAAGGSAAVTATSQVTVRLVDLSLTKSVDVAAAPVGTNVVFTLVVSNAAGGTDATGVAISDPLPAGFAWVSDDAAAGGTSYDRTSGIWTVGNVAAGSARTLRITARVLATGPWWNAAQVSTADQPDLDSTAGNGVGNGEDDEAGVGVAPPGHDGIVDVTDTLRPGEAAVVTITDEDLDLDGGVVESFSTTLLDEATGEVETVLLVETGPATGAFRGSIATAFGTGAGPNGDATLQVKAGDRLACSYSDERTASGGSLTRIDRGLVTGGVDGTIQVAATMDAGSPLVITVVDADLDTNPGAIDAFTIEVINDATGETETVLVSETGPNTGSFTGTVGTTLGTTAGPPGDGALVVRVGDTLTARYLDGFTAAGGSAAVTATSQVTAEVIRLEKTSLKDEVIVGETVGFVLTVHNTSTVPLVGVVIEDTPPPGFKLAEGSARLTRAGGDTVLGTPDDVVVSLPASGFSPLSFGPFDLAAGEQARISYLLRAGAGAVRGSHVNRAVPVLNGVPVGNAASAAIDLVGDPVFDDGRILGKVFEDADRNGMQDPEEAGVPGVTVALDDGTYAVTDAYGRFHLPEVAPGQRMVKLDRRSLAAGSEIVSDESLILWITPGLTAHANFGVVLKTRDESIGQTLVPGLRVEGTAAAAPIEVQGKVEPMTLLVNDRRVDLAESDVSLTTRNLDDLVVLAGNRLKHPVSFHLGVTSPEAVESWRLRLDDAAGRAARVFSGDGPPPDSIDWDGHTDAGELVRAGEIYPYQLEVSFRDGSTAASPRRLLGVNRDKIVSLELRGEAFASGKAELGDKARAALTRVAELLEEQPDEKVVVEGHTDSQGDPASNLELSRRRAESASAYLATRGLSPERVVLRWFGEAKPVASNDLAEGRELNRRVEVKSQLVEVQSTEILERYRTNPSARIDGREIPVGDLGRFSSRIDRTGSGRIGVELSDSEGRAVRSSVPVPTLELDPPRSEIVSASGAPTGRCRPAGAPEEHDGNGTVLPSGGAPAVLRCVVRGRTEPGNVVTADGRRVALAAEGTFEIDAALAPGENTLSVLVRNGEGYSHSATVVLQVMDRDGSGNRVVASGAIPRLTLRLPPEGSELPSGTLSFTGATVAGNRVFAGEQAVVVGPDGSFGGSVELPPGSSKIVFRVEDQAGGTGEISASYEVPRTQLFLMALANGEAGRLQASGHIEGAGLEEESSTYTDGRLAVYLKGRIAGKYLITAALDTGRDSAGEVFGDLGRDEEQRLLTNLDPERFYSVYGDQSTVVFDAQSQGKLYVALDGETIHAVIGNYPLSLTGTELAAYQRTLYGGRFVYQSTAKNGRGEPDTQVVVFGAEVRQAHVRDELSATGGSLYYLSHPEVVEGSEQVTLVVRDKNTRLPLVRTLQRQNFDYTIKYPEGRIVFNRPVASVVEGGSLADGAILSGNPVFVQVDYEALTDSFEKTAKGVRAVQQAGEHLAIGATYVKDALQSGPYELAGIDAEAHLGGGSRVTAEYASSSGADADTFVSTDGGLTFTAAPGGVGVDGDAFKIAADLDVGEWFGKPGRYQVRVYWKDLDPGFSSNGNLGDRGTTKAGLDASLRITGKDTVRARVDDEERAGVAQPGTTTIHSAQWEHRETRWGFAVEWFDRAGDGTTTLAAGGPLPGTFPSGDASYAVGRFWSQLGEKLTGRIERQETLSGTPNDQTTAGVRWQAWRNLALDLQATDGTLGRSAQGGAALTVGESNIYVTERLTDSPSSDRTTTVIGARSPIGKSSTVYSEYQWETAEGEGKTASLVGVQRQWEPGPGLKVLVSAESAKTHTAAQDGERSSIAAGVSYSIPGVLTALTRNEVRFDEGATRHRQLVTFSQIDWTFDPAVTLQARYRYSGTTDRDGGETEARLEEGGLGFAYRPVAHDRFNALGRIARRSDLRPLAAGSSQSASRTVDVLSGETIYQIAPRFEWLAKVAFRVQDEQTEGFDRTDSSSFLTLQRLNLGLWRALDLGAEYRILTESGTKDSRQGWLTELSWKLHRFMRVGVGYNFTDFSDDEFSSNDYSVQGMFFRVQGWY